MEDFSEQDYQSFAESYIHTNILDSISDIVKFYQDEKTVIIETLNRKCIFTMHS
jgi:hypothetical protein